jgi:hypothetical protein
MSFRGAALARLALAAAVLVPAPALADRIDGEWCRGAFAFTIDGPHILTPGGNRILGIYTRHSFTYVVPAGEPEAGSEVRMLLLDEEALQLMRAGAAQSELWQRCRVTS